MVLRGLIDNGDRPLLGIEEGSKLVDHHRSSRPGTKDEQFFHRGCSLADEYMYPQ
jgi:hypothetical protein